MMTPKKLTAEQQQMADTLKKIADQISVEPERIVTETQRKETRSKQSAERRRKLRTEWKNELIPGLGLDDLICLSGLLKTEINNRSKENVEKVEKKASGRPPIDQQVKSEAKALYELLRKLGLSSKQADYILAARFDLSAKQVSRYRK